MPNRPHTTHDCDEDCRGCFQCYRATGFTRCDWNCPHTAETHEDYFEEQRTACKLCDAAHDSAGAAETCEREHEAAHDAWCGCESCAHERAADAAKEMR